MAYTARNLITEVLLDMGVIADEETPTASQAAGGLVKLNDLISAWNIDPQAVFGANEYIIPLIPNQQIYTIGVGGDLNVPKPDLITAAFIRDNTQPAYNRTDYPIVMFNNNEWANLPQKTWVGSFPFLGVWFNEKEPLIEAYVNPVPTAGNYSLVFWADGMNGTLTLDTVLQFPAGYARAIKPNLFIDMAASYQVPIPEQVQVRAMTTKLAIDRHNVQINELQVGGHDWYDIRTNLYRRNP